MINRIVGLFYCVKLRRKVAMSELGQPREPKWTKEDDDFIKNHSYMTVKELANKLNRTEPAIRNRKCKLGVKRENCKHFTDEEKETIKEWYTKDLGVDLEKLSLLLNRPKTSISKIAKEMGLTQYGNYTREERKNRSEKLKNIITSIDHPRGMLNKHHSEETKQNLSIIQKIIAKNTPKDVLHKRAMKAIQTRKENGIPFNTTSNAYSRTKSGKRKDLGNQYFRSSWEANIARILDYENIEWKYEYKRFYFEDESNNVLSYQPDFYLPQFNKWIEVKGWFDEKSKIRIDKFEKEYENEYNNLIIIDSEFYLSLAKEFKYIIAYWEDGSKKASEIVI